MGLNSTFHFVGWFDSDQEDEHGGGGEKRRYSEEQKTRQNKLQQKQCHATAKIRNTNLGKTKNLPPLFLPFEDMKINQIQNLYF